MLSPDDIKRMAFRRHVGDPHQSVSDQDYTIATVIETTKPKHCPLVQRIWCRYLFSKQTQNSAWYCNVSSVYWHCDVKWSTITTKIHLIFGGFAELIVSRAVIFLPAVESKVTADYLTSMVWSPHTQIWWNLIHWLILFCRSVSGRVVWHHDYLPQVFHHTWPYCRCHLQAVKLIVGVI